MLLQIGAHKLWAIRFVRLFGHQTSNTNRTRKVVALLFTRSPKWYVQFHNGNYMCNWLHMQGAYHTAYQLWRLLQFLEFYAIWQWMKWILCEWRRTSRLANSNNKHILFRFCLLQNQKRKSFDRKLCATTFKIHVQRFLGQHRSVIPNGSSQLPRWMGNGSRHNNVHFKSHTLAIGMWELLCCNLQHDTRSQ